MSWIRDLFQRRRVYGDLSAEMGEHLREKVDELVAAGIPLQDAKDTARREFGNMTLTEENGRDVWRWHAIEDFFTDLRYALRTLRKNPGFSSVAILTLALAIGANTAIFSVINAVLLRTLPVRDPQQLMVLTDPAEQGVWAGSADGERILLSYHEYQGLRDNDQVFSGLLAQSSSMVVTNVAVDATNSDPGTPANITMVSGNYWSVLGVEPLQGAAFGPEVDTGLGARPVAIVSYAFWQRRMQQGRDALGRKLRIRQTLFDVIAIMPPGFTGITVGDSPDIWVPLTMQQQIAPGRDWLAYTPGAMFKIMFLQVVGRLKPGITFNQAKASINVTFQQIIQSEAGSITDAARKREMATNFLAPHPGSRGLSSLRSEYTQPLEVLMVLVGLLLLLAAANIANLLLARATARRREVTVRVALGAGRGRLVRQMLTESVLLASLGGLFGLALAYAGDRLLLRMVSDGRAPVPLDVHPDAAVLAFAFGVSLLTGVLFGLVPALRATRLDISEVLRGSARSISGEARTASAIPMGKVLVGAQVAISLLLLVAAGLFVRSLQKLTGLPLGYSAENLLLFRINPSSAGYKSAATGQLFQQFLPKFAAIPGVRAATLSEDGFFIGYDFSDGIEFPGYTPPAGQNMEARFDEIGPGYFAGIGIPILQGRDVTERDTTGPPMCWVNQALARYYFGAQSPLGRQLIVDYRGTKPAFEIAGVVADVKSNDLHDASPRRFYVPYFHPVDPPTAATFEIRYSGDPANIVSAVRGIVRETDPAIDSAEVETIPDLIERGLTRDHLTARLSTFFGVLALLLACIGLYGVLSYNVVRRTSEIGVRMALGAQRRDVLRLVLGDALLVTGIGALVGLAAALAATRLLASLLFGLTPRDPLTLLASVVVLLASGSVAACVPALRASRVDPMAALRHE